MSLEELETKRRKTLFATGILFSLAGVFLLIALGGRLWGFILGTILAAMALERLPDKSQTSLGGPPSRNPRISLLG
jgi:hypothetical protein